MNTHALHTCPRGPHAPVLPAHAPRVTRATAATPGPLLGPEEAHCPLLYHLPASRSSGDGETEAGGPWPAGSRVQALPKVPGGPASEPLHTSRPRAPAAGPGRGCQPTGPPPNSTGLAEGLHTTELSLGLWPCTRPEGQGAAEPGAPLGTGVKATLAHRGSPNLHGHRPRASPSPCSEGGASRARAPNWQGLRPASGLGSGLGQCQHPRQMHTGPTCRWTPGLTQNGVPSLGLPP